MRDDEPMADEDETENMDDVANRKALFMNYKISTYCVLHMAPLKRLNENVAAFDLKVLTCPSKKSALKVLCTCEVFQRFSKAFDAGGAPWSEKPRHRKRKMENMPELPKPLKYGLTLKIGLLTIKCRVNVNGKWT